MKLTRLEAKRYRSLREVSIDVADLNVFIGPNASGKSAILDALRFLQEGVRARDFNAPLFSRGGILNLAWKGEAARQIDLSVSLEDEGKTYEWSVRLVKGDGYGFHVKEHVKELPIGSPTVELLSAEAGEGSWWSGGEGKRVNLKQAPTSCSLAAAAADASFPAREVAEFVARWGFYDPHPFLLRGGWPVLDLGRFDPYGRNFGDTLYRLNISSPETLERVRSATESIAGLPSAIEFYSFEGHYYFSQQEPGLEHPVYQRDASSGTLRMLALMTALLGEPETNLIGIEEPENYIHPTALSSFVEHMLEARERVQLMVTTHSPLLLDLLDEPSTVSVVQRSEQGTAVLREENPDGVRRALEESGFGLGEFHETKGFGS